MHLLDEVDDSTPGAGLTGLLLKPVAWHKDAACLEADPEIFFPERGGSSEAARSYCARCPVSEECLSYALENPKEYGIWGGTSERERWAIAFKGVPARGAHYERPLKTSGCNCTRC